MASKLNLGIKDMYGKAHEEGTRVGQEVEGSAKDLEMKVISMEKNKAPIVSKYWKRWSEFLTNHKVDVKYLALAIPIIATFLIVSVIQNNQTVNTQAAEHQADLSFQVDSADLPPESTFGLWVNSDSGVAFADIELTYNPQVVKLTREIVLKNSLSKKVKVTSMSEANSSGKISIIVGLDPSQRDNPPSGPFQIADLAFNANTTAPDVTTGVSFATSKMQLVAIDQTVFNLSANGVDLILNRTLPTPTPKPGPTSTPHPTPTPAPTPGTLVISDVRATDITSNKAVIRWELSDYGTGQVEYGTTTAYGSFTTAEKSFDWKNHVQKITNLKANTLYHYRVWSSDKNNQKAVSDDHTFKTLATGATPTATPVPTEKFLLSGRVVKKNGHHLVSHITITVKDRQGATVARAKTDKNGHYGFRLAPGSYKVYASGFGYHGSSDTINLKSDRIVNFTISRWRIFDW